MRALRAWVALWDRREHPRALALVRIAMAAVIIVDLLAAVRLGVSVQLFGPLEAGGIGDPLGRQSVPWLYTLVPPTPAGAQGVVLATIGVALALLLGAFSRLSALLLVVLLAQLALVLPPADRGIDMLIRNVLVLLVFARSGEALGLDALRRTGSWWGAAAHRVPAWPRYLLLAQLVMLYFAAGVSKVASSWLPVGGWSALYIAMRDPAFARVPPHWLDALYPLTQLGTFASWLWEWSAPLLLLAFWFRQTRDRPGRVRALFNRLRFARVYLVVGAVFHLGTHLTLQLGIFPFAVMALYPAAFHPDEWRAWGRRFRPRVGAGPVAAGVERGTMQRPPETPAP